MTLQQFIKNLTLKNLKYIIKGYYLKFIQNQYAKHFDKENVMNLMYRAALCHDCIDNLSCTQGCGCSSYELIMSGKSCERLKLEENVES